MNGSAAFCENRFQSRCLGRKSGHVAVTEPFGDEGEDQGVETHPLLPSP